MSTVLYHGSPVDTGVIMPKAVWTTQPLVYATMLKSFALAYTGDQWNDMNINQGSIDGKMYLLELQPGAFLRIFGHRVGYVYELSPEGFEPVKGGSKYELANPNPVTPLKKIVVTDILGEMKKEGVNLIPYDPSSEEYQAAVRRFVQRYQTSPEYKKFMDENKNVNHALYRDVTTLAASSPKNIKDKRKKIESYVLSHITTMDPSGTNTKRYQKMFSEMGDKDFDDFMRSIQSGKMKLILFAPNMKITLKIDNLLKVADSIKLKLFERLKLMDATTRQKYLTKQEYCVLRLPVRRARQFLMHKLSVAESDKKLDSLTGQVTKPDKASAISFVEAQLLYARGLNHVLDEFVKVRGGDIHAFASFKQQLEEGGSANMASLDQGTTPRSAVVMATVLRCMLLDNNLVEGL